MWGMFKWLIPPKVRERRRIAKLAKQARPRAYQDARNLCGAVGPKRIAEEYEAPVGAALGEIARVYAQACYLEETWGVATAGALDGFRDYADSAR